MKREELKALLGDKADDAVIDKIMEMNGKDIQRHQDAATKAGNDLQAAKDQLIEANKQIDAFKEMKPEDLKKAAEDWKSKYDKAVADHADAEKKRLFDAALEKGLTEAKAKNVKTVTPLLDLNGLKYNEADGSLVGLKEQLEKIKADENNNFLFNLEDGDDAPPQIVTGGKTNSSGMDAFEAGLLKGARLDTKPKE